MSVTYHQGKMKLILSTIICLFCGCRGEPEGDVYKSISHMEPLVEIERRLVERSREYLDEEKLKFEALRSFASSVREAMSLSQEDPLKFLGNPVNSYLLIKRFTSGWKDLAELISAEDDKANDIKTILESNEIYLPTYEKDMVGATAAMFRLQETYNITARQISDGEIEGIEKSVHQLTAEQCLEIAELAHQARKYLQMKNWLFEAKRIYFDPALQHRVGNVTKIAIHEFLAWTYYLSNNMVEALRYTNLILDEEPNYEPAVKNLAFFEFYRDENVESWLTPEQWDYREELVTEKLFCRSRYVRACDEKLGYKPKNMIDPNNARCFYKTDRPRLVLKPLKVTQYHDNPLVYVFHNILTERQMEIIRNLADPRLQPAQVIDPVNEKHVQASYRVSKTVFFDEAFEEELLISNEIRPNLEDATNLNAQFSEQLQVNNYGLGGQYEFHKDHGEPGSSLDRHEYGNRISTLLIYLSDVERGGHTVFTKLGLSLKPKMGDAAFWFNLQKNGTGIDASEHASCPVVSGSKWVANKWFHTFGNEFTRPCTLNRLD